MSSSSIAEVPRSHRDLVERALPATLVTLLTDGRPQASVVWFLFDVNTGTLSINSERGRRKVSNLERDGRATLLIVDPADQHRYIELRCDLDSITADGALDHRAELDRRYLGPHHYSDPTDDRGERVIITLRPIRIVTA